jgi:hypothetical protein
MAQDWSVHALVYFCSAIDDLSGAVLYWHLDMEFTDMKTIIEMAQECGLIGMRPHLDGIYQEALAAFAALVAAAEREACAKVCDDLYRAWTLEADEDEIEPPDAIDCKLAIQARGQA